VLDSVTDGSAGIRIGKGRYRLGQRLGGGGSSDVYRAIDTVLERPVAVKLFRACADPTAERRFQAEARLIATLAHPALVTIYDTGVEHERAYQVLQLVEGTTLRDRLIDGPLDPSEVTAIGIRLAEALAYVHARGIVHRDVKPSNVIGDGEHVYLADFGISRLLDGAHLTATGLAVGTAAYMAPEQVRGDDVGPAADVYSLGLVLLESVTGQREYPGGATETAMARLSRPPLVPTRLPAPLPSLLAAMTRDDPRERPSAEACAMSLRDGAPVPSATEAAALGTTATLPAATDADEPGNTGRTDTVVAPAIFPPTTPLAAGSTAGTMAAGTPPVEEQPAASSPGTTRHADATSAGSTPLRGDRRRMALAGLAAIAVVLTLVIGAFALVDDRKPNQDPADTNPKPTAPTSSAPAQNTNRTGSSPKVVVPPSSDANTPAVTPSPPPATTQPSARPSAEPSQEPTQEPTGPPSSEGGGDDDGGDDGSSGPGPGGGDGSNGRNKGKG
jgi:serine/threonine protein kinase